MIINDNDYKEDKNNIDNNGSRKELQGDNQSNDDVDEPDDNIIPDNSSEENNISEDNEHEVNE